MTKLERGLAAAEGLFWLTALALLLAFAPWPVAAMGLAWAALAAALPWPYLLTFALALPFFGNNPGGPHHLYLLDAGLMGFALRDLALRVAGRRPVQPRAASLLVNLIALVATLALIPQRTFLYCEAMTERLRFFYSIYNHYGNASMFGGRVWLDLMLAARVFRALRDAPPPVIWRRRFWLALLGALVAASILGLLDLAHVISLTWWRPENPNITRFGYARLDSLFWHSGWFAQYLGLAAPGALALGLAGRGRARWGWFAVTALLGATQLFTMQRGGWLAFLFGNAAVAAMMAAGMPAPFRRRFFAACGAVALAGVLAIGAAAAVNKPLRNRIGEIAKFSDRALIWRGGIEIGRIFPWSGAGIGNYGATHRFFFKDDDPLSKADDRTTAHNTLIHTFAERGVFGFTLLVLLGGWLFFALIRKRPDDGDEARFFPGERAALFGALTALLVDGMFQYIFYMRVTETMFWIYAGIIAGVFALPPSEPAFRSMKRAGWTAAAIIFAVMIYTQRDRLRPWMFYQEGRNYLTAGQEISIPLPPGARRVLVPVCAAPDKKFGKPAVFAFWLDKRLLATQVFDEHLAAEVTLDLPADRNPATPLTIKANYEIKPYLDSWKQVPILRLGVGYLPPRVIE